MRSKYFVLIALLLAFAVIGAACASQDDNTPTSQDDAGDVQKGGSIVLGWEQEPAGSLNIDLACCTLAYGRWIEGEIFEGAMEAQPDFTYAPNLVEADPEITEDPFTLTYHIREEAQWSDGEPVTADDFIFTLDTIMNKKNDMASRSGFELITDSEAVDEKTVKFTFSEAYAGWRDLFNPIYPKHAIEGADFNKVWNKCWCDKDGNPISSGPWLFDSWDKGSQLKLVRNDNYWGQVANADELVFRFLPETNTEIQSILGNEVDIIYPSPQLELKRLTGNPDITVTTTPGTTWEHLDIQVGPNGNPALQNLYVRQALAYAIDRDGLVAQQFKDIAPDLTPLNNTIYMTNAPEYAPNWEMYSQDVDKATGLLEDNGCKKGSDGIYVCDGEKLSFEFTTTTGNALRELTFEILQEQVKAAGIELKPAFGEAADVFGPKILVAGNYDLFMFAWVGNPDPGGSVEIWKCKGAQNFTGYCNEEVTKLLDDSQAMLDNDERAAALNEADALMAQDIPTIPIYQKPTILAFNSTIHGMEDNATQEGPTWNSEEWWIEQ
jgi:peptide/nickel transport system substrate-binding protein